MEYPFVISNKEENKQQQNAIADNRMEMCTILFHPFA